jgi:hypothetical protein
MRLETRMRLEPWAQTTKPCFVVCALSLTRTATAAAAAAGGWHWLP